MPACQPILGLGVRHIQLALLTWALFNDIVTMQTVLLPPGDLNATTNKERAFLNSMTPAVRDEIKAISIAARSVGRIIAGILSLKVNNKYLLLFTNWLLVISEALLPYMSVNFGSTTCLLIRTFGSFVESFHFPSIVVILSRWTPEREISFGASCLVIAQHFGGVLVFYTEGTLYITSFASLRYTCALLNFVWSVLWFFFGAQDPKTCYYLSDKEKKYLYQELGNFRRIHWKAPVPWKQWLKTKYLYIVGLLLFANVWFLDVLKRTVAFYRSRTTDVRMSLGVVILCIVLIISIGYACDLLLRRGVRLTPLRKIIIGFGFWSSSSSALCLAFFESHDTKNIFSNFLPLTSVFSRMYFTLYFDLARNSSGLFAALITAPTNFTYILSGLFMDYWHDYKEPTTHATEDLMYMGCLLMFFTNLTFLMSGEIVMPSFDSEGAVDWRRESVLTYP